MKKKTYSVFLALGASVFLFSKHALAHTVIYDPLNPKNAITPIANEETQSSTDNKQTKAQLALDNPKKQSVSAKKVGNHLATDKDKGPKAIRNSAYLSNRPVKNKKAKWDENPAYMPPYHAQAKNNVLILDEEFFAPATIVALPPEGNHKSGNAIHEWTEIAQSAYLLSGLVLYGEKSGELAVGRAEFVG